MKENHTQLLDLFRHLDKKELRNLKKFVRSPFHNQREDVILLFDYLSKQQPFTRPTKVTNAAIFAVVYPQKSYHSADFYHLCFYLKRVIEKYLIFREKEQEEELLLAKIYRRKGLDSYFKNSITSAEKKLQKQTLRNADFQLHNFLLQQEKLEFSGKRSRSNSDNLQAATDELSIYFISQKLKHACHALSQKSFAQVDFEDTFFKEVLRYAKSMSYEKNIPAIAVYYTYYQAFTQQGGDFETLRNLVKKYNGVFPVQEVRDIYLMPINFGIKEFNSGKKHYLREVFDLYKQALKYGVFLDNGMLSRYTYSNINSAALGLKEFAWAETFLQEYKPFLDVKNRDNVYQYNLATLYFREPDYAKAMDLLQTVEFTDLIYNIESRRMLLKIYFSLGEEDALYSLLDSFKRFLYRHKELGYHRESFLNLIRFVSRLLTLSAMDKLDCEKLLAEIEEVTEVADKEWLLEKVRDALQGKTTKT